MHIPFYITWTSVVAFSYFIITISVCYCPCKKHLDLWEFLWVHLSQTVDSRQEAGFQWIAETLENGSFASYFMYQNQRRRRRGLHEFHWWCIREVGESKVGKSLRLDKKWNEEKHTSFALVDVGRLIAFTAHRDGMWGTRYQWGDLWSAALVGGRALRIWKKRGLLWCFKGE